ncbi:MAG: hypothetical protein ABW220_04635 [Burkholderiaceae bacterium]
MAPIMPAMAPAASRWTAALPEATPAPARPRASRPAAGIAYDRVLLLQMQSICIYSSAQKMP